MKKVSIEKIRVKKILITGFSIMLLICFVTVSMIYFISINHQSYQNEINDYLDSAKAINELKNTSSFLTRQASFFALNQEREFFDNYISEVYVKRTREKTLQVLRMTHDVDTVGVNATFGYNESKYLEKRELYAMKLILEGINISADSLPDVINFLPYKDNDETLSLEQKIEKGNSIIFGSDYLASKNRFEDYFNKAQTSLLINILEKNNQNDAFFYRCFKSGIIILILFIISIIIIAVVISIFIVKPFKNSISYIKKGEKVRVKSFYELQYLIDTYNSAFDSEIIKTKELRHKAEHDSLTNLINRNAFNEIKNVLCNSMEPIAFLLIDIDFFKKVNDDYGHLIGDEVLKKLSRMLMEQFRSTDYVVRFGGDEFAVIMTKFGDSPEEIIKSKIENMNNKLQNVTDGLPAVSLSVGVSFSECGFNDKMIEFADEALYKVKKGGRCNCSFYKVNKINKS